MYRFYERSDRIRWNYMTQDVVLKKYKTRVTLFVLRKNPFGILPLLIDSIPIWNSLLKLHQLLGSNYSRQQTEWANHRRIRLGSVPIDGKFLIYAINDESIYSVH